MVSLARGRSAGAVEEPGRRRLWEMWLLSGTPGARVALLAKRKAISQEPQKAALTRIRGHNTLEHSVDGRCVALESKERVSSECARETLPFKIGQELAHTDTDAAARQRAYTSPCRRAVGGS